MPSFIFPTDAKRITSEFGSRWGSKHNGIDIAEGGYHPVYAIADGKVRRSYLSSSYGNCIMIEHHVDGIKWESVYAHMRDGSREVVNGENVEKGQKIGVMGNTGNSTGQHLHFELHKNGNWNINKTNAVDPLNYIEKDDNKKDGLSMSQYTELKDLIESLQGQITTLRNNNEELKKELDKKIKSFYDKNEMLEDWVYDAIAEKFDGIAPYLTKPEGWKEKVVNYNADINELFSVLILAFLNKSKNSK